MGLEDTAEMTQNGAEENKNGMGTSQDPTAVGFMDLLKELGADKLFEE